MNIAIPIYGSRVMPRFGCTRDIIIVTVEDETIISKKHVTITQETQTSLFALFTSEQISTVICGGIHPRFQQVFQEHDIQLIWGVIGEWQEILQAYLQGKLQSDPTFCVCQGHGERTRFRRGQQRRS